MSVLGKHFFIFSINLTPISSVSIRAGSTADENTSVTREQEGPKRFPTYNKSPHTAHARNNFFARLALILWCPDTRYRSPRAGTFPSPHKRAHTDAHVHTQTGRGAPPPRVIIAGPVWLLRASRKTAIFSPRALGSLSSAAAGVGRAKVPPSVSVSRVLPSPPTPLADILSPPRPLQRGEKCARRARAAGPIGRAHYEFVLYVYISTPKSLCSARGKCWLCSARPLGIDWLWEGSSWFLVCYFCCCANVCWLWAV